MPVTTNANDLSIVHRGSGGIASATLPDVCKTPSAGGTPVPVPYPNIALSADLVQGTTTVMVDGQMAAIQGSKFVKSTGDEAGVAGGIVSGVFIMEATFISFSPTVSMDGRPVCRLTDKMLMNRGNTACLGGVLQTPIPPSDSSAPVSTEPEKPKFCYVRNLKLKCGHGSRNFRLDAHKYIGATLQVIADKKDETVELSYEGDCGVLQVSPGCAKLHVIDENGKEMPLHGNKVSLPLNRDSGRFPSDWWALIRKLGPSTELNADMYTVYGTHCNGTGSDEVPGSEYAQIEVFPNAGWSGELEFGYTVDKKEKKLIPLTTYNNEQKLDKIKHATLYEKQGTFAVKGKLEAYVGRTPLSIEAGVEGKANKADSDPLSRAAFRYTQAIIDRLSKVLWFIEDYYATKFDIRWPCIKIGGGVALAEQEEKPTVGTEGTFSIDASPLIGLQVSTDILDWLIYAAGALIPALAPFSQYLVRVKHRLKSGLTAGGKKQDENANAKLDIGIVLTIGGEIGGGLGWKFSQGKVQTDTDKARIEAKVDFKLEALAKVEAKVFIIKANAYISLSAMSAGGSGPSQITGKVFPKEGKDFAFTGSLSYNGLAVWYAYYFELGAEAELGNKEKDEGEEDGKASTKSAKPKAEPDSKGAVKPAFGSKAVDERGCLGVIWDPWEWPRPSEKTIVEAM
jgi:uncharacterized Zn-binding protein involved in type VI secretion